MTNSELRDDAVIAIPAYNCGPQITRVLTALREAGLGSMNIWVVDNGSTDATVRNAISTKSVLPRLRVFVNAKNVNLGGSHKAVFRNAKEFGFSHVIILHGDDQASPSDINRMFDLSKKMGGASVLGARFMKESKLQGYDWKRILGNKILNLLYSLVAGRLLYDLGSGLNLFRLLDLDPKTYEKFGNTITFNYQLILDLIRRNVSFSFLPILWREEDQTSNARNISVFMTGVGILVAWIFKFKDSQSRIEDQNVPWKEVLS
jgi:glycosyltransferase involved in cell wall biosynthesis